VENFKHGPKLQALSAALPHISPAHQKNVAVMIKLMEIKEICRHYDAMTHSADENWRQNMVGAIIPHVGEKSAAKLQSLMQIMEMQDMVANFEKFKEMELWK